MTSSSIVLFTTRRGAFKAVYYKDWMVDLIEQRRVQGITRPTFVMDNTPDHSRLDQLEE